MNAYSKGTWLWIGFVLTVMVVLIGMLEDYLPAGSLSTDLMLGIVAIGYASIFAWLYHHRAPAKQSKQPRGLRLVGRHDNMIVYESYTVEESLGDYLATQRK